MDSQRLKKRLNSVTSTDVHGNQVQFDHFKISLFHPVNYLYVVPYNPFLLMKYQSHLNIEIVSNFASVRYLYKYVTKGFDKAKVKLKNEYEFDEMKEYTKVFEKILNQTSIVFFKTIFSQTFVKMHATLDQWKQHGVCIIMIYTKIQPL